MDFINVITFYQNSWKVIDFLKKYILKSQQNLSCLLMLKGYIQYSSLTQNSQRSGK